MGGILSQQATVLGRNQDEITLVRPELFEEGEEHNQHMRAASTASRIAIEL
jgi:hypothetical protein